MSSVVFLSIGSNLPDGYSHINNAFNFLRSNYSLVICSDIYSTPSVSQGDDSIYFNAVAKCVVEDFEGLNCELKSYESNAGRIKGAKNVVIDLDIVIVDEEIIRPRDFNREYFQIGYKQILKDNK